LVWALRFIQAVLLICPIDGVGAARAIPIAFNLAPPVPKPKKKRAPKTASADTNDKSDANMKKGGKKTQDPEWKQYYKVRRQPGSLASRRPTPDPPLDHHLPPGLSRSRASALSPARLLVGHRSDCRCGSSAPSLLLSLGSRSRSEGRKRSARCRPGSSLVQTS